MTEFGKVPALLVINAALERLGQAQPLHCLWVAVGDDRDSYARDIHEQAANRPIIALPVRDVQFSDPNTLLQDLATLIERSRSIIEGERGSFFRDAGKGVLVLVARRTLNVPLTSSPVTLPNWFPICAGETQYLGIDDITWTAAELLSASTLQLDQLCALLYELDGIMLRCLRMAYERDRRVVNGLFDRIRTSDPPERLEDFLTAASRAREQVRNSSAYRPSTARADFLIARLWRLISNTPANRATAVAAALAAALGLDNETVGVAPESIFGVLNRPTAPDASGATRFARNLLHVVRMSCQLTTAAAHADDYPTFPFSLQRSISIDLRKALDDAILTCQRTLTPDGAADIEGL